MKKVKLGTRYLFLSATAFVFILLLSIGSGKVSAQNDDDDSAVCSEGSEWECYSVSYNTRTNECAYQLGNGCTWCDCF